MYLHLNNIDNNRSLASNKIEHDYDGSGAFNNFSNNNDRMYFSFSSIARKSSVIPIYRNKFAFLESTLLASFYVPDNDFIKPIYRRDEKIKYYMKYYMEYKKSGGYTKCYLYAYSNMLRGIFSSKPVPDNIASSEYFFLVSNPYVSFQTMRLFKKSNFYSVNDRALKLSKIFTAESSAANAESKRIYDLSCVQRVSVNYNSNIVNRGFSDSVFKEALEHFYSTN